MKTEITYIKLGVDGVDVFLERDYMGADDILKSVLTSLKKHNDFLLKCGEEVRNLIVGIDEPTSLNIRAAKHELRTHGYDIVYGIADGEEHMPTENTQEHLFINVETNEIRRMSVEVEDTFDYLAYYAEVIKLLGLDNNPFLSDDNSTFKRMFSTMEMTEIACGRVTDSLAEAFDNMLYELGFIRYVVTE